MSEEKVLIVRAKRRGVWENRIRDPGSEPFSCPESMFSPNWMKIVEEPAEKAEAGDETTQTAGAKKTSKKAAKKKTSKKAASRGQDKTENQSAASD